MPAPHAELLCAHLLCCHHRDHGGVGCQHRTSCCRHFTLLSVDFALPFAPLELPCFLLVGVPSHWLLGRVGRSRKCSGVLHHRVIHHHLAREAFHFVRAGMPS